MTSKIFVILILQVFQIIFELGEAKNFDSTLGIFKPSTIINLGKPLAPGDVITVTGYYSDSGTEASFDLENDYCDWPTRKLAGCIEYDLFIQFHTNKFYRRINVDGNWKHHIDTYYPTFMQKSKFELIITVKEDHFETTLDGFELNRLNYTEPISSLSKFSTYGFVYVEYFNIQRSEKSIILNQNFDKI